MTSKIVSRTQMIGVCSIVLTYLKIDCQAEKQKYKFSLGMVDLIQIMVKTTLLMHIPCWNLRCITVQGDNTHTDLKPSMFSIHWMFVGAVNI